MIVVMGATGHTGGAVAQGLLAARRSIRVVSRSADRLKPLVARGAEAAVGDQSDPKFLTAVLRGVDAVYAVIPPDYTAPDLNALYHRHGGALERAIKSSGVPRVVFLSSLGAELPEGTGPIGALHDVEERLKGLGVDLLILRPGYFFENLYGSLGLIKHKGVNGGATRPDVALSMLATADIGAAAADEFVRGTFRGTTVRELLGPRDYTFAEVTRILGAKIGKPDLKYVQFSDADFMSGLMQAGFSHGAAQAFVEMAHACNERKVRSLEGRNARNTTPTTFETFADQLAAAYRKL